MRRASVWSSNVFRQGVVSTRADGMNCCSLNASPCGRFTCSTWWSDGSNYDDDDGRLLDFAPQ